MPFNLGEATVSRAVMRLATGEVGFGYALGRDLQKARMIALCDGLAQSDEFSDKLEAKVIAPLREGMLSRGGAARPRRRRRRGSISTPWCAARAE